MREVYVLVKQVPGRPNGEVTLHGATDKEIVSDTWSAADLNNISFFADTDCPPEFERFQWEEEDDD